MANQIHQYSILSALMHGICHDGLPLQRLLRYGDHGIGTTSGFNAEVIIVDGKLHNFPPNGPLKEIEPNDTIPFIMVTRFEPTLNKQLSTLSLEGSPPCLIEALSPLLPAQQNQFLSIRIDAMFPRITFRVVPAQAKVRDSLADVVKHQVSREYTDVSGVLFGFWSPLYSTGFSIPGFHFHFVSSDRSFGGHVKDFEARDVQLKAATISDYHIELPASVEFNDELLDNVPVEGLDTATRS